MYLCSAKHKSHNAPGGSDAYGKRIIIYLVKFSFIYFFFYLCDTDCIFSVNKDYHNWKMQKILLNGGYMSAF